MLILSFKVRGVKIWNLILEEEISDKMSHNFYFNIDLTTVDST